MSFEDLNEAYKVLELGNVQLDHKRIVIKLSNST